MQGTNRPTRDDLSIPPIRRTRLEVVDFNTDPVKGAERVIALQKARNYKADCAAALEKEARKEHYFELAAEFVCNLICGGVLFGVLGLALFLGSI